MSTAILVHYFSILYINCLERRLVQNIEVLHSLSKEKEKKKSKNIYANILNERPGTESAWHTEETGLLLVSIWISIPDPECTIESS